MNAPAIALGRVLMALIFIIAGYGKLNGMEGTVGYISSVGLPAPQLAYYVALVVELGGGILLIAGLATRWVSLALALFCLVTGFMFHGFADMNNQIHTLKNIAMAGGFLVLAGVGAGAWSVDALIGGRGRVAQPA